MDTEDPQEPSRMSGADRARLHRERNRMRQVQVAVGVAKLVLGQSAGEQSNAVRDLLEKAGELGDLPEGYARTIERAVERLTGRRGF